MSDFSRDRPPRGPDATPPKSEIGNPKFLFCDVSLPVPLDQAFTYALPETLRHRVRPGCRVLVPFGPRRLTGVVLRTHDDPPAMEAREALRLIDAQPVLDEFFALPDRLPRSGTCCASDLRPAGIDSEREAP